MLAIVELIVGIAKAVFAVLEFIGFLFDTGMGLRWLLSPSFRRKLREPGNERKKSEYVLAAIFSGLILTLALVLAVSLIVQK